MIISQYFVLNFLTISIHYAAPEVAVATEAKCERDHAHSNPIKCHKMKRHCLTKCKDSPSSSVMSCKPMVRKVGSLSSGSCLMFSLSSCWLRGCTKGPEVDNPAKTGLLACGEGCPECVMGPKGLLDVGDGDVGEW